MRCNSTEEFLLSAAYIGSKLKLHMNPFMCNYFDGWIEELFVRKGLADWKMPWHEYNLRAGASGVVPGTIAEMITSIVAPHVCGISSNLILIQDEKQQKAGIDLKDLDNGITIQTKTYINHSGFDRVYESKEITNPTTDYIALVDIDKYRCYIIRSERLKQYISTKPLYRQIGKNNPLGWACQTHELEEISKNTQIETNHLYYNQRYSKLQCLQLKEFFKYNII